MLSRHNIQTGVRLAAIGCGVAFYPPISGLMNLRISELAIGMGEEEGMEESFVHS